MSDSEIEMGTAPQAEPSQQPYMITLSDSEEDLEITPMQRSTCRPKVAPAWGKAARKSERAGLGASKASANVPTRNVVHSSLRARKLVGGRPTLPTFGSPFNSERSTSRDSSVMSEELGNHQMKAIEIVRPALVSFTLDISELRLLASSLPPPSSSTERVLQIEATLTVGSAESPGMRQAVTSDATTGLVLASFRPRPMSPYWSPTPSSYSNLVPHPPFSFSFDLAAPTVESDVQRDTPLIKATLTLSIVDPTTNALIFNETIPLIQKDYLLVVEETRCIRPLAEQEAYVEARWRWNVPRAATMMGVTAREMKMGGRQAGKGKLSQKGMEKILEKALEEGERMVKMDMLNATEYLSELDLNNLKALEKPTKRSAFRPKGMPPPARPARIVSVDLLAATNCIDVRPKVAPIPRSDFVAFVALGTPYPFVDLELPPLTTSLWIKSLEDRSVEREIKDETFLEGTFEQMLFVVEEEGKNKKDGEKRGSNGTRRIGANGETLVLREGDLENIFDRESFAPAEQLLTIRDFYALSILVSSLSIHPAKLKDPALAGHVDVLKLERFVAEDDVEVGEELRKALDVFAARVGRTAWEVQRAHRTLSFDEVIFDFSKPPLCAMCGARSCFVHLADTSADNIPTSTSYAAQSRKHAQRQKHASSSSSESLCRPSCRYQHREPSNKPWTNAEEQQCDDLIKAMPELDACELGMMVQKHCAEVRNFFNARDHSPAPLQPLDGPPSITASLKPPAPSKFPLAESLGYDPCDCKGHCSVSKGKSMADCLCVFHESWCDRFCGCAGDCPRRFRGCDCWSSRTACEPDKCPCRLASRECDPHLCACPSATCINSQIRRRDLKRTMIVDSIKPDAGYGLAMVESAKKGDLIGLYGGESFCLGEAFGRLTQSTSSAIGVSYWYDLVRDHAIDSQVFGSALRFINDLPENYNCECRHTYIDGTAQMAIYASKDLEAGEELSLDYGPEYWANLQGVERETKA